MLGTIIGSSVLALFALAALVRVAWLQRQTRNAAATIRAWEQRVKDAAIEVTIIGSRLGPGRRKLGIVNVESAGFELRRTDGSIVPVAKGARVDLFCDTVRVDDSQVTVPDGTKLLFLPPEADTGESPYKTPGGLVYTRGDSLMLFARDAVLMMSPSRQRRTSIVRMTIFGLLPATTIVLCILYAPNTGWNGLLFLLIVFLGLDLFLVRGLVSWIACTRPPPPLPADLLRSSTSA